MDKHLAIEQLISMYRELDKDSRALVEQHVMECNTCRVTFMAYQQMDQQLSRRALGQQQYILRQSTHLPKNPTLSTLNARKGEKRFSWVPQRITPQFVGASAMALLLVVLLSRILSYLPPLTSSLVNSSPQIGSAHDIVDPLYAVPTVLESKNIVEPSLPPKFLFGVDALMEDEYQIEQVASATDNLSITWVKQSLQWSSVQPAAGNLPDFTPFDHVVDAASSINVNLLVTISETPEWLELTTQAEEDALSDISGAFSIFLQQFAKHYCGTAVGAIELWDEQNMHYRWRDQRPNVKLYVALVKTGAAAIKSACPTIFVLSGGLAPGGDNLPYSIDDVRYFKLMLDAGVADLVDGIGIHLPGYNVPPSVTWQEACAVITKDQVFFAGPCHSPHHSWSFRSTLDEYKAALASHRLEHVPVWVTQFGWPAGKSVKPSYLYVADNSFDEQASWTIEAIQMLQETPSVDAAFLFNLNYSRADETYPVQSLWSIVDQSGAPSLTYRELAQIDLTRLDQDNVD